jgi:hypothetical protein
VIDYSDEPGWPAEPTSTRRELTQLQKGAELTNWKRREGHRAHPYCAFCICDECSKGAP